MVVKGKCLFKHFAHFSRIICLFLVYRNSLYILNKSKPFVSYRISKYHFLLCVLLFTVLIVSLHKQNFLNGCRPVYQLGLLWYMVCAFGLFKEIVAFAKVINIFSFASLWAFCWSTILILTHNTFWLFLTLCISV